MIEIFVEQISERLIYTLDFVFNERELSYKLNNDFLSFENSILPKFNYSERFFENIPQIVPATLLFDEDIFIYSIEIAKFKTEDCLSFNRIVDPLASIFYILSRMEEYTINREDDHGRFSSKFSIQNTYNWLDKAICDRWAIDFIGFLESTTSATLEIKHQKVNVRPTFDIDNTYAYQWKRGFRKWASIVRDRIQLNKKRIEERKKVELGEIKDPYDTFDYIKSIADRGYDVNVFWLLGDYSKYDKNITHQDIRHQNLILNMNEKTVVGIHPSYNSNSYEFHVKEEKERLEKIIGDEVINTRQHFLKLKVRVTYSNLNSLGFKNDYSMGYADCVGFRSGTARPHFWFDLSKNKITDLMIHPFVYMDGTLNEYLKLSIDESKNVIWKLFTEVTRFGGDFIFIWHNETIGNYGHWNGWNEILEYTLSLKNRQ
jgi:hypothetical protein